MFFQAIAARYHGITKFTIANHWQNCQLLAMAPTIIEQPSAAATEATKAKFWRKSRGLTRKELAALTGYSVSAISLFEQGYDHKGKPLGERAWRRYRCCCAGIGIAEWNWGAGERDPTFMKDVAAGRKLLEQKK